MGDGRAALGVAMVAASAVAFSTAGLFTRLIAVDVWTMLFWRGVFGGLLILIAVLWTERSVPRMGAAGLLSAACSTLGTVCFITALRATTVANVTVLYATAPFLAAGIAWLWMREVPGRVTLLASVLALAGVVVMLGEAAFAGGGGMVGDVLALVMTGLMALMMVNNRRHRHVSMLPAACLSAFACAAVVLPLARPWSVTGGELGLLALFGVSQFGLGLLLLTVGTRHLAAVRASLLVNLELPLAPLWVWLAFGEVPGVAGWVGGLVVCVALVVDMRWGGRGGG